jgi:hypothetical protein
VAKKDTALNDLLSEVDPSFKKKLKSAEPRVIDKGTGKTPEPFPKRPVTQARRNAFAQLCFDKESAQEELRDTQGRIDRIMTKIEASVQMMGRKMGDHDTVFYTEGKIATAKKKMATVAAKGLIKFKQTGDIDAGMVMDWARKHYPTLILVEKSKTLNVQLLQDAIEEKQVPKFVQEALKVVLEFAKPSPQFYQETKEEDLDLAAYEGAKIQKKIPEFLINAAEKKSGHTATSSWLLDLAPRCAGCGKNKPKRQKPGEKSACKDCGFEE